MRIPAHNPAPHFRNMASITWKIPLHLSMLHNYLHNMGCIRSNGSIPPAGVASFNIKTTSRSWGGDPLFSGGIKAQCALIGAAKAIVSLHLQEKVLELWEVTRGKLEATAAAVRERERELEARQDRHAMELKARHAPVIGLSVCVIFCSAPGAGLKAQELSAFRPAVQGDLQPSCDLSQ